MTKRTSCLILFLALSTAVAAQNEAVLWTGGIGADERETAPTEGTKLVFFVEAGNFLSGVQVRITNAEGREVVNTVSEGPWMLLRLPAGTYTVHASLQDGRAQGGHIEVSGDSQEFGFMFRGN